MRYILLIYDDEKGWANLSEAERQHSMGEFEKLRQEIAGQYVAGSQLHPTSATTSVRTRNGKRMGDRRSIRRDTRANRGLLTHRRQGS
jgi:hypothetical protein